MGPARAGPSDPGGHRRGGAHHRPPLVLALLVVAALVVGALLLPRVRTTSSPGDTVGDARLPAAPIVGRPRTGAPRLAVIGDSWSCGEGTGPAPGLSRVDAGFAGQAARELGWVFEVSCIGGTGYTTEEHAFSTRAGHVIAFGPDVVLLQGSTNDGQATGAAIEAEADVLLSTLRSALPRARLLVMGPAYTPAAHRRLVDVGREALRHAAHHQGATWLDVAGAGVLDQGTDFADGVHPNDRGHRRIARWLVASLD